jgi:hypothetical protein
MRAACDIERLTGIATARYRKYEGVSKLHATIIDHSRGSET